jgi:hypothetical protein
VFGLLFPPVQDGVPLVLGGERGCGQDVGDLIPGGVVGAFGHYCRGQEVLGEL